ncbi:MAG: sialidase family protein, partial [Candidatus Dormibacteria bacterium]
GRTWTVNTLGPPIFAAMGGQTGTGWTPKGGPQGTFIAVFAATPGSSATSGWESLAEMRSTDGGQTWSGPVVVNDDDPSLQYTSFCPMVQVAPNGRVDLVWETNRDQVNDHFAVYYTYSTDGGATWAKNAQASDQGTNFDFGVSYNGDIRQPAGVASANQYAAFGWADTRLANATTQTQDDYGAMSQFATIPSPNTAPWPLIVAIIDGLATAAIIGGLVAFARRRMRASAAAPEAKRPVSAS